MSECFYVDFNAMSLYSNTQLDDWVRVTWPI